MLVIVGVTLIAFLGLAALAIDLGSFFQQQRQAQSAVDAAALAGAQELPGSTANATTQAQSYVTQNLPGGNPPGISFNSTSTQITVSVSKQVPSFFGQTLGLTSANVSAKAVAGLRAVPSCSAPGTSCYAIFAKDNNCTSGNNAVTITGGNINIGAILTNGSLSTTGGNETFGKTTIGPAAPASPPCKWSNNGSGKTFGSNSAPTPGPGTSGWPIDYSLDFPPCTTTCPGPLGTPSYCTQASIGATWAVAPAVNSPQIYCGVGSGNPKDPKTWTGAMTVTTAAGGSSSSPQEDTYVAGSVNFPLASGGYAEPCGYATAGYVAAGCPAGVPPPAYSANYPLVYAVLAGPAVTVTGGGASFIGDTFAPLGTINFTGGGLTTGFLEGWDVAFQGGNFTAAGPANTSTSFSSFGTVALLQ
ncbi:MAG: pilus assembly protein TadG-related protein [Solirubrobacteraceae bacterium]